MSWTSTCANCGAPRDAADRFCAACGAANPQSAAAPPSEPERAPAAAPTPPPVAAPAATPTPPPVAAPTPPPVAAAAPPVFAPTPAPAVAPAPVFQSSAPVIQFGSNGGAGASTPFDAKGLFRSLYDFKFTSFIATKVIRFVYALLVVVYSILAVIWLLLCVATGNAAVILLGLIFVPLGYLIYLIVLRICTELVMVFFKMGEDVHAIRYGTTGPGLGGGAS